MGRKLFRLLVNAALDGRVVLGPPLAIGKTDIVAATIRNRSTLRNMLDICGAGTACPCICCPNFRIVAKPFLGSTKITGYAVNILRVFTCIAIIIRLGDAERDAPAAGSAADRSGTRAGQTGSNQPGTDGR